MPEQYYTCIIVDDEPKAIRLLEDKISQLYNNIKVIGAYTSWTAALEALRKNDFDILFLDIAMPQKNGMSLLKLVPELKAEIIFVTAYAEYALSAFSFSASGYILKPVKDAALAKTVNKSLERIGNKNTTIQNAGLHTAGPARIGIPNNKGLDYVNLDDVVYIEAIARYTRIVSTDRKLLSSYSIGKFREMITDQRFRQVHRSFIINLDFIRRYETTGLVIMSDGTQIPVAKSSREELLKALTGPAKTD